MRVQLNTDQFETNGKIYEVSAFTKKESSTSITLDVVVNPYTKRQITVPISEVEWLDEA